MGAREGANDAHKKWEEEGVEDWGRRGLGNSATLRAPAEILPEGRMYKLSE